ncbi:hypothetical protein P691DRAFT_544902 [Macrolepiota fuliginosa MF-IS2]|uniref:SH3 domain-containing protein n=1 Tax=Macrolepiota fuliginosa MF-IS2 TaxID=1400762 RepID=A0A9P5XI07_9AGAR|nr:hypothetical protein P691DRAFT_544902 [Macrolepiota fuliginosa MF-IS2]
MSASATHESLDTRLGIPTKGGSTSTTPVPTQISTTMPESTPLPQSEKNQASHDIRIAVIISSVTLGLVVILIILLIWRRSRRRGKQKDLPIESGRHLTSESQTGFEDKGVVNDGSPITRTETIVEEDSRRSVTLGVKERRVPVSSNLSNPEILASRNVDIPIIPPRAGSQITILRSPLFSDCGSNKSVRLGGRRSSSVVLLGTPSPRAHEADPNCTVMDSQSSLSRRSLPAPVEGQSPDIGAVQPGPQTGEDFQPPYDFGTMTKLFPARMKVLLTFVPQSEDELDVKQGEMLQILGIFDDGWCLCKTETGGHGVVPVACLDVSEVGLRPQGDGMGAGADVSRAGSHSREGGGTEETIESVVWATNRSEGVTDVSRDTERTSSPIAMGQDS